MPTSRGADVFDAVTRYGAGGLGTGKAFGGDVLSWTSPATATPATSRGGAVTRSSVFGGAFITYVSRGGSANTNGFGSAGVVFAVPTIQNITPGAGTSITPTTPLAFDVIAYVSLPMVQVHALLFLREVVHDGFTFLDPYADSTRTALPGGNGYHYNIIRRGGWLAAPTFYMYAVDKRGDVG